MILPQSQLSTEINAQLIYCDNEKNKQTPVFLSLSENDLVAIAQFP